MMTAKLATTGVDLALIQTQANDLNSQNLEYSEEITKASTMKQIASEAKRLGFVKVERIVSLTADIPIALGR